jgi:hypothetical protein
MSAAPNLALAEAVRGIEVHVAASGWDQPTRLYALAETAELVRRQPSLAGQLGAGTSGGSGASPAISGVEQEGLPAHGSVEELLAGLAWPAEVLGAAIAVERVMLPPEAEPHLPSDEDEALRWVAEHPDRQEVRVVVGVLRDGSRECVVRLRTHDSDGEVLRGPNLVPALADALAATLAD